MTEHDGEPDVDWSKDAAIMLALMRLAAKLDEIERLLMGEDGGEEEEGLDT